MNAPDPPLDPPRPLVKPDPPQFIYPPDVKEFCESIVGVIPLLPDYTQQVLRANISMFIKEAPSYGLGNIRTIVNTVVDSCIKITERVPTPSSPERRNAANIMLDFTGTNDRVYAFACAILNRTPTNEGDVQHIQRYFQQNSY